MPSGAVGQGPVVTFSVLQASGAHVGYKYAHSLVPAHVRIAAMFFCILAANE